MPKNSHGYFYKDRNYTTGIQKAAAITVLPHYGFITDWQSAIIEKQPVIDY